LIRFDKKNNLFILETPNTSYIIAVIDSFYLGHIYYGKKLSSEDADALIRLSRADIAHGVPSVNKRDKVGFLDNYPMEYSFAGTGDFREACIDVTAENGDQGLELHYDSYKIYPGKNALTDLPSVRGCEKCCDSLDIILKDDVLSLKVILTYSVYKDSDAITRSVKIINESSETLHLTKALSACMDIDMQGGKILTLHGAWGREREITEVEALPGAVVAESKRGKSSAEENPFIALLSDKADFDNGEVYAMNFVYSGNFLAKAARDQSDKVRMVMGIHPFHFNWELRSNESFQTPECVLVYSDKGLNGMSHCFHDLYREHLIPEKWAHAEKPVLINNWEATLTNFNKDILVDFAKEASKLGLDMLVMDDGWFGNRFDDNRALGDWYVNEEKLPGGLKALSEEINKAGLKFGIWVEPEMINEDSDLYRAHPDWAFHLKGREKNLGRNQCVLDLTREEVWNGVYSQIKTSLSSGNIAYVKWDMNRALTDVASLALPAEKQGEVFHRFVLAVYRMQNALLADFPDILLENCSSGGGRFDPAMLYYSPQIWTSDNTDAIERLSIQEGTALVYPMSTMGAHVADCPSFATGRTTDFETRADVAMAGTFGYELDIRNIKDEEKELIPDQIKRFRIVNPIIRDGDYYRIASYRKNRFYDCWESVTKDKEKAIFTFVEIHAESNKPSRKIRFKGLNPNKEYTLSVLHDGRARKKGENASGLDGLKAHGSTLMNAGIIINRMSDFKSLQILLH